MASGPGKKHAARSTSRSELPLRTDDGEPRGAVGEGVTAYDGMSAGCEVGNSARACELRGLRCRPPHRGPARARALRLAWLPPRNLGVFSVLLALRSPWSRRRGNHNTRILFPPVSLPASTEPRDAVRWAAKPDKPDRAAAAPNLARNARCLVMRKPTRLAQG